MQSQWLLYRMTKNCKGLMIDFSFDPSPFRSVGTQKEKPSLTSRGLSQMASYLVYLTANTLSCISLITTATSYHLTLQRYEYYLNRKIFFKVFFEVIVTYPIYMGMKIILL